MAVKTLKLLNRIAGVARFMPIGFQLRVPSASATLALHAGHHPRRALVKGLLLLAALVLLLARPAPLMSADTGQSTPPFVAEGTIITEFFNEAGTAPIHKGEGDFYFVYSNAVWQIDVTHKTPAQMAGARSSCKRIPDGVRVFTAHPPSAESAKAMVPATAVPMEFPPVEHPFLLACWLSLTPNPALPVLGPSQIRRFLLLNQMAEPENRGSFSATYISRDRPFLSGLNITNNGVIFQLGAESTRYQGPYASGFLEMKYELLDTTNCAGILFPSRSVLRRFAPKQASKDPELFIICEETVQVRRIEVLGAASKPSSPPEIPSRLFAMDRRPTGLPKDMAVNHIVTNDQWVSTTNRELAELAMIHRKMGKNRGNVKVGYLVGFLLVVVVAPGAALLLARSRPTKNAKMIG